MFDILGFKALRAKLGTLGLHQQFIRGILPAIQHSAAGKGKHIQEDGRGLFVPDFSETSVSYRAISDSVIFFTQDDSLRSFLNIVNSSSILLCFGFNGGRAPYRGAIGWGDLLDDPAGLLIGSALEDAHYCESAQVWAGGMLTPACNEFVKTNGYVDAYRQFYSNLAAETPEDDVRISLLQMGRRLVEYDVPLQTNPKTGPVEYSLFRTYAIDWTLRMYEGAAAASFEQSENRHAQTIAANTEAFERWARTNNL